MMEWWESGGERSLVVKVSKVSEVSVVSEEGEIIRTVIGH
jgi:hypothetical protein